MTSSAFIQRGLKYASRSLYLIAAAGTLYVAVPAFQSMDDGPKLAKNVYASVDFGFTNPTIQKSSILLPFFLQLNAADRVLTDRRAIDAKFGDGWQISDKTLDVLKNPAKARSAHVWVSCVKGEQELFAIAAQANPGYTVKQVMDVTADSVTYPEALNFGLNVYAHQGTTNTFEAYNNPWWHIPKMSYQHNVSDKKAELLKYFPNIALDCAPTKSVTSTSDEVMAQLADLKSLPPPPLSVGQKQSVALPSLGLENVVLTRAIGSDGELLVTFEAKQQDTAAKDKLFKSYQQVTALIKEKAPVSSMYIGHNEGDQFWQDEFTLVDGVIRTGWRWTPDKKEATFKVFFEKKIPKIEQKLSKN